MIGRRDFASMPPIRRLSNTLGGWVFSAAVGQRVADNQSGYRLIGRRLMDALLDSDEIRLRVRGRDDRPVHRARPSDRRRPDPDHLRGRAEPHPPVAPFHRVPACEPRRPPDRQRRLTAHTEREHYPHAEHQVVGEVAPARPSSRSSPVRKNLSAAASSRKPITTLTLFSQPPLLGSFLSRLGNSASTKNGDGERAGERQRRRATSSPPASTGRTPPCRRSRPGTGRRR